MPFGEGHRHTPFRCDLCIETGRSRCVACGDEVQAKPGTLGRGMCERCRRGDTDEQRLREPFVRISCRGGEGFDGRRSPRCEHQRILTRPTTGSLKLYDARTASYVCDRCFAS